MAQRVGLNLLKGGGATDGQVPAWDAATGRWVPASGGAGGGVQSIVAGTNVTVDDTDPANPIVSASGGGGGGGSASPLDPVTLNATYGDHFLGTDLDTSKWNRAGSYVDADDYAANSWLVVAARPAGSYYWQPAPAGDWTLVGKFSTDRAGNTMFGLMALDGSGNGVGATPYHSPNAPLAATIVGGVYSSGFQSAGTPPGATLYDSVPFYWIALTKTGTNYTVKASKNGLWWGPSSAALANAATITRVGFGAFFSSGMVKFGIDYFDIQ